MKKIYIKPNTKYIILEAPLLMSGSNFSTDVDEAEEGEEFGTRQQGSPIWDSWK